MRLIVYGSFSGSFATFFSRPIAPQNIPSWILLLHVRSHPTGCRHSNIRSATVLRAMVRLNHTDVIVRWQNQTPRSSAYTQTEPRALYRSIFDAVRDMLHDEAFEGHDQVMARYLKPDLLILDDMGIKQLPKRSGEYLFEVIMRRHGLRSTMMTSNRPFEDWGKLIGDVPAATAILDRLLENAEVIQITGKSYRLRGKTGSKEK